jgi:CRP/FNR family transcriptional regulator
VLRQHVLHHLAAEINVHRQAMARRAERQPLTKVADWLSETQRTSGLSIPLPGGQQGIAEELGLSRVSVNRALSVLSAAGAVRVRPRLVDVLDPAYLIRISDSSYRALGR